MLPQPVPQVIPAVPNTEWDVRLQRAKTKTRLINRIKKDILEFPKIVVPIMISVGQLYHENGHFSAFLEAVRDLFPIEHRAKVKFKIIIADKLQRFGDFIKLVPDAAPDIKLQKFIMQSKDAEGKRWQARSEHDIEMTLGEGNYEFIHWDDLAPQDPSHPNYERFTELSTSYRYHYQNDAAFKTLVDKAINRYLANNLK